MSFCLQCWLGMQQGGGGVVVGGGWEWGGGAGEGGEGRGELLRKDIITLRRTGRGTHGQWGVIETTFAYFRHKQIRSLIRKMHGKTNSTKEGC